jgi:ABC-type Zn uptake system ZnuABC Zn-binding protein ZnuA
MTPEKALEDFDANNDSHISWDEFWASWEHDDHDEEGHDEDGHDEEHYGVVVLFPNNCLQMYGAEHDMLPENASGWNLTTSAMMGNESLMLNYTVHPTYGTNLQGINGVMAADDYSWYWQLMLWNESATVPAWEVSNVGIDSVHIPETAEHIAWAPNSSDMSLLPDLSMMHHDDDHGSDMVCYDMSTHTVNTAYTTESDCEAAGLMWTASTGGPDTHDDHEGHDDEDSLDYDPHSWLSPLAFKAQVNVVLDGLTAAFPAGEEVFKVNADAYSVELTSLAIAYDTAFGEEGTCSVAGKEKTVAANHNAYSYIAVEYGIQFVTVHGLDPEGEPSPEDVAKVVNFINEEGITVLFVEEYTDQSSVQSLVDQTGVTIQILYTMEMAPSDVEDNYMTMMTKNLDNLVAGIGC